MTVMKTFSTAIILTGLVSWVFPTQGQQLFSLEEAVQTALRKNQLIQSSEYEVEYYKELKKSSSDIGKTSAFWMHGQYNSIYQDNNFTVLQNLPFPTLISSQIQLGKEQITGAQKNVVNTQNDIAYEVRSAYYQYLYLDANKVLLQSLDSLYADFTKAASRKYTSGESNLLEKTTAETQWMEVRNQMRLNDADLQIASTRLQSLLRNDVPVVTSEVLARRPVPAELDTATLDRNPQLNYLQQQARISRSAKKVERNRLLPDIGIGYFNQSLTGVQNVNGQDLYYGRSKHFQGFELGLYIPLWFPPLVARSKAAAFHEEAAQKTAEHFKTSLQGMYSQALQELDKNQASLSYYEDSALKNATLILMQSRRSYKAGEISYTEYLQSIRNANAIKSNYLQSLNMYNQSVIRIEYLIGKF
jgi:heavy metal efflux system protein